MCGRVNRNTRKVLFIKRTEGLMFFFLQELMLGSDIPGDYFLTKSSCMCQDILLCMGAAILLGSAAPRGKCPVGEGATGHRRLTQIQ